MRASVLWREFESGDAVVLRVLRFLVLAGGMLFLCYTAVLPMHWTGQLLLAAVTIGIAILVNRSSTSHVATLTLLLLSMYSTVRYAFFRVSGVVSFLRSPLSQWNWMDAVLMLLLLAAELYAFTTLALGYVQVLWPLRRKPVPLPDEPAAWPAVDLLIPTRGEPMTVLRPTALAALNIDWPAEKLNVYILDDDARPEVRAFAEQAGIAYIARTEREHAKAGNLNHALGEVNSPFVAVFDCDHVPTRSFLQLTMGWMVRDEKLAMLQTPHHFYSPDPFERNLDEFRTLPTEGDLYYRVVQDGNDFWNAASFCGSCAVLRRSALDEVGGFAVETPTEDAHTSLRLQMSGYNTAYINIPQAAGLAPERLADYIRQRVRWARGMLQVLRLEDPLTAPGLSAGQRLCYFHATAHFLFAIPRLIFLTAPLAWLLFGRTILPGFWAAIVAYALPHLVLSEINRGRIQREHRHAFWNSIYETVLAPFLLWPTVATLFQSRAAEFNVTRKGGIVERDYFAGAVALPFLLLLALNLVGALAGVARLVRFPVLRVPTWASFLNVAAGVYDPHHAGVVAVNLVWVLFNTIVLAVATAVARERQQRRAAVRLSVALPSDIILPDGSMLQGVTCDLSSGGVRTRLDGQAHVKAGEVVRFVFPLLDGSASFSAKAVVQHGDELRARFEDLNLEEQEALTTLLYSRADTWLTWKQNTSHIHPIRSFLRLLRLALRGLGVGWKRKQPLATSIAPMLLLAILAIAGVSHAQSGGDASPAQPATPDSPAASPPPPAQAPTVAFVRRPARLVTPPADFNQTLTLASLGLAPSQMLRGTDASLDLDFSLARNHLVQTATLQISYRVSPALAGGLSHILVKLNGAVISTLPATNAVAAPVTLPANLLRHQNRLTFESVAHSAGACDNAASPLLWAQIDGSSTLSLSGSRLTMTSDLASLPLPFVDPASGTKLSVPLSCF